MVFNCKVIIVIINESSNETLLKHLQLEMNKNYHISDTPVTLSAKHSAPDRRARVRGSPGKTPPFTLMAPGACKIRLGYNVFQVPFQNYASRGIKAGGGVPSEADQNCDSISPDHL